MKRILIALACGVSACAQQIDWNKQIKNKPVIDVREYGAKGNGSTDDTAAIQAALNALGTSASARQSLHIPAGEYKLTSCLSVPAASASVRFSIKGDGPYVTRLRVAPSFSLACSGVVSIPANATNLAPEIADLAIVADQPWGSGTAAYTHWPAFIMGDNAQRGIVRNVLFQGAWTGISLKGTLNGSSVYTSTPSGWTVDHLEGSAYGALIDIDGTWDTHRISNVHHWPYMGLSSPTLSQQQDMFESGVYGIKMRACESCMIDNFLSGAGKALYVARGPAQQNSVVQATNIWVDAMGSVEVTGGTLNITNSIFWHNQAFGSLTCVGPNLKITGGDVKVTTSTFNKACVAYPQVSISRGLGTGSYYDHTTILANNFFYDLSQDAASEPAIDITTTGADYNNITGNRFYRYTAPASSVSFTNPMVRNTSSFGRLQFTDNTFVNISTGTGSSSTSLALTADLIGNMVLNNSFEDWSLSLPSSKVNGMYQDGGDYYLNRVLINPKGVLPTSCSGAVSGKSLWNDSGTVKICP